MGIVHRKGYVFHIDSALVYPDIEPVEVGGEPGWKLPTIQNEEYKYGMISDVLSEEGLNFLWASKDEKNWVLALFVFIDGERLSINDLEVE